MADTMTIWKTLDVPGWRRVVYFETVPGTWDRAPDDTSPDDPRIVRVEQWIVAGDQYIYAASDADVPLLGEAGDEDAGCHADAEVDFPGILQLARLRIARGAWASVHPVLRALVSAGEPRPLKPTFTFPAVEVQDGAWVAPLFQKWIADLAAQSPARMAAQRGPARDATDALLELYGRLMIQSALPHWSREAQRAFRVAAQMCLAIADGRGFDETGSGLPDPVPEPPGPWGPVTLGLREKYQGIPAQEAGGEKVPDRVFRGGSWGSGAGLVRAASRGARHPAVRGDFLGFRVVKVGSEAPDQVFRGGSWGSGARGVRVASRVADPPRVRNTALGFRVVKGRDR